MSNDTTQQIETMVAYGGVVTVRHVPTRQVSQIIIEIPEEHHAAATVMLTGKNAFVLAATGKVSSPYGVVPLSTMDKKDSSPTIPSPAADAAEKSQPVMHRTGNGGLRVSVDPSKWLGIECQNAAFMYWLNVGSSAEAAEAARAVCGVTSRKDIAKDPRAMAKFMDKIYHPYRRHSQQTANSLQALRV